MGMEQKSTNGLSIDERINSLSKNLSLEKKQYLIELLQEWQQNERRQDKRLPCLMAVDFSNRDRVYHEFIRDLSRGGVFIQTRETFDVGEQVTLTFTTQKYQVHFKLSGKIARLEDNGIGVQFDRQLSEYQKDVIRKNI